MKQILYLEIPTPQIERVKDWLRNQFQPTIGYKHRTPDGMVVRLSAGKAGEISPGEISVFVWTVQRTTYLKAFRYAVRPLPGESCLLKQLTQALRAEFPEQFPVLPAIDPVILEPETPPEAIFTALGSAYPLTVKYFQKMPNGAADLRRAYWWEQRWRENVRNPQQPKPVIVQRPRMGADHELEALPPTYDLIYVGGALGVLHAVVMARLGYRVLLLERLPFGRMNREWNISRSEFQNLIDLGLFTPNEFESIIASEYKDGFHKFFDANSPNHCRAAVLPIPTVLNIAIDTSKLLQLCGQKLRQAGGEIWDATEFIKAEVGRSQVWLQAHHLPSGAERQASGRLLVDAMGTASPIAWQLNGGRTFDSVCPTVGAVVTGFPKEVWDPQYGDVLNSHGDISRGRQLIWELFPGSGDELTFYLFHYHQVNAENPGSLLEMYEDFFTILPEYRRCDPEQLNWVKPTFGYIPGHFSVGSQERRVAFDRLLAIGDAASLQSPLIFTGFGSMVRNLPRLTDLLDTALKHDLLTATDLNRIRAYQSNIAVTWLFSRGMMVPQGYKIPPERVNAMLNTFFGVLGQQSPVQAEAFVKDRTHWWDFNRMALKAGVQNPTLLLWIWRVVGPLGMLRWLVSYLSFSWAALAHLLFVGWFPETLRRLQPWLETARPSLWLQLLAWSYELRYSVGQGQVESPLEDKPTPTSTLNVVES